MNLNLNYGYGEKALSLENIVLFSDKKLFEIDYLLFVDSRGLVNNSDKFECSYIYLLKKRLDLRGLSYLIISRPKNLTIFSTIFNFLQLNSNLKFKYLITNLGLVDCTPKKQDNIDDIILQLRQFSNRNYYLAEYEEYRLHSGNVEFLKSIEYSEKYIIELNTFLESKFEKLYFLNTPIISEDIKIDRERPRSFFTKLYKTNELVDNIVNLNKKKNILIDIKELTYTYDGVHYTKEGHQLIYNRIKESIHL